MGSGQNKGESGKFEKGFDREFNRGSYRVPLFGDQPMDRHIEFKATDGEGRQLDILFDEHRKLFGWRTKSDMFREMMYLGRKQVFEAIPRPDDELAEMVEQEAVMLAGQRRILRHRHAEQMMETTQAAIDGLVQRRNWGEVRRQLAEAREACRHTKSPALKQAMVEEFNRRFGRQWQELNKSASLKPSDWAREREGDDRDFTEPE